MQTTVVFLQVSMTSVKPNRDIVAYCSIATNNLSVVDLSDFTTSLAEGGMAGSVSETHLNTTGMQGTRVRGAVGTIVLVLQFTSQTS